LVLRELHNIGEQGFEASKAAVSKSLKPGSKPAARHVAPVLVDLFDVVVKSQSDNAVPGFPRSKFDPVK